jgi:hypothetical protein
MSFRMPPDVPCDYLITNYRPFGEFVAVQSRAISAEEVEASRARWLASRVSSYDEELDKAIFGDPITEQGQRLLDYYRSTGRRPWCLNPRSLSVIKQAPVKGGSTTNTSLSDETYMTVMDCLLLKRDAQTPLLCPDGQTRYPMKVMPGLTVGMRILGHADPVKATKISQLVTGLLKKLHTKSKSDSVEILANPESGEAEDYGDTKAAGRINMAVLRALWLLAIDYKSYRILSSDDFLTLSSEDVAARSLADAVKTSRQAAKGIDKDSSGSKGMPVLGAQQTEYLRLNDVDGGLALLFAATCEDKAVSIPSNRCDMARYVMYDSPVLNEMVKIVFENKRKGHRTLIAVDNPWIQQ